MLKRFLVAAAMSLAFTTNAAAQTQGPPIDAATDADLRCMIVGLAMLDAYSENSQEGRAGLMIAMHYLGRVKGRSPQLDLEEALFSLSQHMTQQELGADGIRCGGEVIATGQEMITIGRHLQERTP